MSGYSREFFQGRMAGAGASAGVVTPLALSWTRAASVLDVGCGTGSWLAAFMGLGVTDVLGIDGDYVDRSALEIPAERFRAMDLSKPFDVGRVFDLAVSLEVGEHLPPETSEAFVESLCRAAPVVLFSAAVPMQGGTGHVNERWQGDWASMFARRGFVAVDAVRPVVWGDERVAWWYRQNTLVYVRETDLGRYPELAAARARTNDGALSVVHPILLEKRNRKPLRSMGAASVARAWFRAALGR